MTARQIGFAVLGASALSVLIDARGAQSPQTVRPSSISGAPSSALHCVSGNAANVHGLGWVDVGTGYTITFDSTVALNTSIARLDLAGNQVAVVNGTPDLRFTASTAGSMALYVSGRGAAACYRYQVAIQAPSSASASAVPESAPHDPVVRLTSPGLSAEKVRKETLHTLSFPGDPTSAKQCVSSSLISKVHGLGRVEAGNRVTISFDSDFDPVAGVTLINQETGYNGYLVDDDSGGNGEPFMDFIAPQAGTLALYVASYGGPGCYRYKVEIDGVTAGPTPTPGPTGSPRPTPAPTPTPTPTPAPGTRSFKAAWINASWIGGRTGTPLSSKGIDPNTGVFGVLCPVNSITLYNHSQDFTFTDGLHVRNNCSTALDVAICRTSGSGGGSTNVPVCATDPRETPFSNVLGVHIGRTIGQPQFIATTPLNFDVNILWCSDQSTFNFGKVRGVAQLDCVPK